MAVLLIRETVASRSIIAFNLEEDGMDVRNVIYVNI